MRCKSHLSITSLDNFGTVQRLLTSSFSMYRFCSTKIYMHTRHLKRFQRGKKSFYHTFADDYCILHHIRFTDSDGNRTDSFRKVFMPRTSNRFRYFRFIRSNIIIIYNRKVRRNNARVKSSARLLRLLSALWSVRTNVIPTVENSRRIYRAHNVYDIIPLQPRRTFLRLFCLSAQIRFCSVDLENVISKLFEHRFGIVETNRGVECFRLSLLARDKQPDLRIRCPNSVAIVECKKRFVPKTGPRAQKKKMEVNRI